MRLESALPMPRPTVSRTQPQFRGNSNDEPTGAFFKKQVDPLEPIALEGQVITKTRQTYDNFAPDYYLKVSVDPKVAAKHGLKKHVGWFKVDFPIYEKIKQDATVPMVITFRKTWFFKRIKPKLIVDDYQISKQTRN